ncbi:MFS transporter [Nocardiopsis potens]|uniref:MFS transporter n=1 Tax=Nocardiopsis potens TaxID=1246458 RepID=UPI000346CA35|nr:MFS transporter [Nocardiopsis potens]
MRSSPPAAGGTDRVARRARAAVSGVFFTTGLAFATLVTRVPALQARFELGEGELTAVLALVPVVAGAGSVLAGSASVRFGSRRVVRVAQPALVLAVAAAGTVPTLPGLYAAVAAVGLLLGAVDATMNTQAVAVERRYGTSLLTGFHAVWSAGAVLGSLWAAFTSDPGRGVGLAAAFGAAAAVGLAVSLTAGPLLHRDAPAERGGGAGPDAEAAGAAPRPRIPWRPILLVGSALAVVYIADSAVSSWSAVYIEAALGSAALAPLGYGAYQATTLLGRALGDHAVRRFGPVAVVRAGAGAAFAGLACATGAPSAWVAVAGFALTGLGASVVMPIGFSAAGRLDPDGGGTAVARVNVSNYVGFVLGAVLIGGIAEALDLRAAFAAPTALLLGAVLLARSFDPPRPGAGPAGSPGSAAESARG